MALLAALALVPAAVAAQTVAPVVDNYYAAGETVVLPAPIDGDAVVAGRVVDVAQPVSGDVLAAGWRVTVASQVDDDLRAAGSEVDVRAPVGGDITAAAGRLSIGPGVTVNGRAWLSGGVVRADGVFMREVRIAGDRVQIGGEIRQPVRVVAQRLEILPKARILAPMSYDGATPAVIAEGAVLAQPLTYRNISADAARQARWPRGPSSVVFGLHLFVGGVLLLLLLPRLARKPAELLDAQPARSLFAGMALVVTVPFVALLLVISLVGLPAGLALGALYAAALFLGLVTTAIFVGNVEARLLRLAPSATAGRHVVLLLAGAFTLAVFRSIPVLGTLVVFASIVVGVGALGVWTYRTYMNAPLAAPAT
jgi:hypothetical protein